MMLPPSSTPSIKYSTGGGVAAAVVDTGAGVVVAAVDTGVGVAAADTGAGVAAAAAADTGVGVVAADTGAGVAAVAADIGAGAAGGDVRFQRAFQQTGQTAEDGRPVI